MVGMMMTETTGKTNFDSKISMSSSKGKTGIVGEVGLSEDIDKKLNDLSSGESPEQEKEIKPKKGRPKKKEPEPVLPFSQYPKEVCKIIAELIPFVAIASITKDKNYELNDEEKEMLAPMWDLILVKRLPSIVGKYSEEFLLASTVLAIIKNKTDFIKSMEEKENADENENPEVGK